MQTKACNLTENEIKELLNYYGRQLAMSEGDDEIARINYLYKRLKAFKEPEVSETIKSDNSAAGWGSGNAQS